MPVICTVFNTSSEISSLAQQGSLEIVNKLLSYGADVKFQNTSGKDALMLACFAGKIF